MMLIVKLCALFVIVCTRAVAKVHTELHDLCMPSLVGYTCNKVCTSNLQNIQTRQASTSLSFTISSIYCLPN